MILKWIVCRVPKGMESRFSAAQEGWRALSRAPGFLAQGGGWDARCPGHACIAGLWQDRPSLDHFMAEIHDPLYEATQQEGTYSASCVTLGEPVFPMPGRHAGLLEALDQGRVLRVAECQVKPGRQNSFREVQEGVWRPAMARAKGMLGGAFLRAIDRPNRYLVLTVWEDQACHERYAKEQVPQLSERAGVTQDLEGLQGRLVLLEPGWAVRRHPGPW